MIILKRYKKEKYLIKVLVSLDIKNLLIVSPHMDDDILGCGGLLANISKQNNTEITIIYLTDGTRGNVSLQRDLRLKEIRKKEAISALNMLGIKNRTLVYIDAEDMRLKPEPEIINIVRKTIENKRPDIIITNPPQDSHPDHQTCAIILKKALTTLPNHFLPKEILLYEVYTALPINRILDITSVISIKQKAIKEHYSQLKLLPYDQYNLGLNRFRGLHLAITGENIIRYGEGFQAMTAKDFFRLSE